MSGISSAKRIYKIARVLCGKIKVGEEFHGQAFPPPSKQNIEDVFLCRSADCVRPLK